MNAPGDTAPRLPRRPPGRLGVYAPWPLVGVTVLLVALIVFTPQLLSIGSRHPGVGILTQAELVVDKIPGNATFHFYVWALGEEIRYDVINVGVATLFNWTGTTAVNWSAINWTEWHNGTNVLSVIVSSTANPVALNISAFYSSPSTGSSTWYVGVFAFYVSVSSGGESLYSTSPTPGVAVPPPGYSVSNGLPDPILLHNAGPGGAP